MRNIRLLLEYDGTRYHGWQRQKNALTIQEVLEAALGKLTGEAVKVLGSGRTDAGVHARGQVANFRTSVTIPLKAFHEGLNSMLPYDIAVLEAAEAPPDFHARKSARSKTYEYRILNRSTRSPLYHNYAWRVEDSLDLEAMEQAARALMGQHDFTAFQASGSGIKNPVREVLGSKWRREPEDWLVYTVTANGFLRGMARSLVGTMVETGRGKFPPGHLQQVLESRERRRAGPTAPAQGLYLVAVEY
ncbi:MAG: tRNA pseudouridine(38-40) synthase TruA [Deltaproteobacteria bacterium]|nr:tRNA pseudouridine(38-40) synthase TruA [Deltaproteobacteria bacterium]